MSNRPRLLTIGIDSDTLLLLKQSLESADVTSMGLDLEALLEPIEPAPAVILAAADTTQASIEVAQVLRGSYQDAPIFLCCKDVERFERKDFIKNGFTDAFLMPVDFELLKTGLIEAIASAGAGVKVYRSVKILDLAAGETLDFDTNLYLPGNKKYIRISNAGDEIDQERLEKIKKNKINSLQVPLGQMKSFYEYSGKKLRQIGSNTAMSATERRDKMGESVRALMSDMFSQEAASFQTGQAVLKTCEGIVSSFIIQGAEDDWFLRIKQVVGEFGGHYSHSSNVSTLAAMFSMGTGIGKPEEMALAGLLHDLGKSQLPHEVQALEQDQMNPDQLVLYKKHPEMSINLIKTKKISTPEIVTKMILQHHELYNGTGFPSGLFGDRICKEAQLLALADRFDHLTKVRPGLPMVSPVDAIKEIKKEQVDDPSKIRYKPELLKALFALFPVE